MYPVVASPVEETALAMRSALLADATLMALATGVYGHVPEAARVTYPYVVIGTRTGNGDAGAMQVAGTNVAIQVDFFNGRNPTAASNEIGYGPVHRMMRRVWSLLERREIGVAGMVVGSLTRESETVFDEPDEDAPGQRLYHGVQRWLAEVHEV